MFVYYLIFVYCDLLGIFTIVTRYAVPASTVYNWDVFFLKERTCSDLKHHSYSLNAGLADFYIALPNSLTIRYSDE